MDWNNLGPLQRFLLTFSDWFAIRKKAYADLSGQLPNIRGELKKALDAHIARCANIPWRLPNGLGPGELGEPNRP